MLGGESLETGKAAQAEDGRRICGRVLYQSSRRLWHASSRYRRQRGSRSAHFSSTLSRHLLISKGQWITSIRLALDNNCFNMLAHLGSPIAKNDGDAQANRPARNGRGLVSFSSRLRLLALQRRRQHTAGQSSSSLPQNEMPEDMTVFRTTTPSSCRSRCGSHSVGQGQGCH
jgi:hypothetical protein